MSESSAGVRRAWLPALTVAATTVAFVIGATLVMFSAFMFYDDELNVNKGLVDLMNRIAGLGMGLKLRGFIKAELFTDEQAEAMYRAGFRWILVGFESGSERILENIRKNATRADNTRCVEIAPNIPSETMGFASASIGACGPKYPLRASR